MKSAKREAHETSRINFQTGHMGSSCSYRTIRLLDVHQKKGYAVRLVGFQEDSLF